MDFYALTSSDIPKELMPQLILDVEVSELNIQAGLQDRVVQVYEGLVSMDFAEELMASRGYGSYRVAVQFLCWPLFVHSVLLDNICFFLYVSNFPILGFCQDI